MASSIGLVFGSAIALFVLLLRSQDGPTAISAEAALDKRAIEALDAVRPWSVAFNVEVSGALCRISDRSVLAGSARMTAALESVTAADCPKDSSLVGLYHTHGAFGSSRPTVQDLDVANQNIGIAYYLAAPCGSIVRWHGPRAADSVNALRECVR
jgi:hypothetical protein